MIKNTLVSFLLICAGSSFAQDIPSSSVPQVVKNALTNTHQNPQDVEWEKKGEYYNVEYEIGKHDHELWISPQGKIVKHKEEISSSSLPVGIKNKIKTDYKGYRTDDIDKITWGNKVLYKVEVQKGHGDSKEEIDLILDENGKAYDRSDWNKIE